MWNRLEQLCLYCLQGKRAAVCGLQLNPMEAPASYCLKSLVILQSTVMLTTCCFAHCATLSSLLHMSVQLDKDVRNIWQKQSVVRCCGRDLRRIYNRNEVVLHARFLQLYLLHPQCLAIELISVSLKSNALSGSSSHMGPCGHVHAPDVTDSCPSSLASRPLRIQSEAKDSQR